MFSSFAASFITAGLCLWGGEEEKLRKIDQRAGMDSLPGSVAKGATSGQKAGRATWRIAGGIC